MEQQSLSLAQRKQQVVAERISFADYEHPPGMQPGVAMLKHLVATTARQRAFPPLAMHVPPTFVHNPQTDEDEEDALEDGLWLETDAATGAVVTTTDVTDERLYAAVISRGPDGKPNDPAGRRTVCVMKKGRGSGGGTDATALGMADLHDSMLRRHTMGTAAFQRLVRPRK